MAFLVPANSLPSGSAAGQGWLAIAPIRFTQRYESIPSLSMEQPGTSPFVHTRAWGHRSKPGRFSDHPLRVPPFYLAWHQGDLNEY